MESNQNIMDKDLEQMSREQLIGDVATEDRSSSRRAGLHSRLCAVSTVARRSSTECSADKGAILANAQRMNREVTIKDHLCTSAGMRTIGQVTENERREHGRHYS
jgi:hypothetical protein